MSQRVYSFDETYAAMCIWEEMCTPTLSDAGMPWQDLIEGSGTGQMRHWIIEDLANACDTAWDRASQLREAEFSAWMVRKQEHEVRGEPFEEPRPNDPGSFDWDFVPVWLRTAVDWSGDAPRVLGSK